MNLNTALMKSIDEEDALKEKINIFEQLLGDAEKEIDDLNTTIIKSAGIINYLEHKLEQATQLKISGGED